MSRDEREIERVLTKQIKQTNRQTEMKRKRREFILVLQAAHATQPHLPHLPHPPHLPTRTQPIGCNRQIFSKMPLFKDYRNDLSSRLTRNPPNPHLFIPYL